MFIFCYQAALFLLLFAVDFLSEAAFSLYTTHSGLRDQPCPSWVLRVQVSAPIPLQLPDPLQQQTIHLAVWNLDGEIRAMPGRKLEHRKTQPRLEPLRNQLSTAGRLCWKVHVDRKFQGTSHVIAKGKIKPSARETLSQ